MEDRSRSVPPLALPTVQPSFALDTEAVLGCGVLLQGREEGERRTASRHGEQRRAVPLVSLQDLTPEPVGGGVPTQRERSLPHALQCSLRPLHPSPDGVPTSPYGGCWDLAGRRAELGGGQTSWRAKGKPLAGRGRRAPQRVSGSLPCFYIVLREHVSCALRQTGGTRKPLREGGGQTPSRRG